MGKREEYINAQKQYVLKESIQSSEHKMSPNDWGESNVLPSSRYLFFSSQKWNFNSSERMYTARCAQSSHALIYNISFIYKLLLLTLSAHWFETPLNRTQWPPDPTLLPVADCQVGRSVCVVKKHKNMELGNANKPYHYLITLRHFTLNFDNPLVMNSNLLCHHWACWCGAPAQESNA